MARLTITLLAAAVAGFAVSAQAQDAAGPAEPTPFVTLSGTAAFLTDYRFRGVSLSDRDIAGQGSITATFAPGVFLGIWGSSIEPIGAYEQSDGRISQAKQEIDLSGGFSKTFGAFTPTIGAIGYIYPGGRGVDYVEVYGTVAGTAGPVGLTLGVNYAPKQDNVFNGPEGRRTDSLYIYGLASAAIPNTPFSIQASVGRERGAFAYDSRSKIDYMVGVSAKYKVLTLSVQYIGNNLRDSLTDANPVLRHNAKDGVVGSITAAF